MFPRTARTRLLGSLAAALVGTSLVACGDGDRGASGKRGSDSTASTGATAPEKPPATTPQNPPAKLPGQLFARDSVWNKPLSPDAEIDPRSEELTAKLRAEVRAERRARTGPWINTLEYSTPLVVVPAGQPTVKVHLKDPDESSRQALAKAFEEVPLPPKARPAPGTDGHLTVWQPSTDKLWEFFRFKRRQGRPTAAWGGAIEKVSKSPGYYTTDSWPGAQPFWGATATSLPVIGGTMLYDELRSGRIEHALALALPDGRAGEFAFPAQRTDGTLTDPAAIPEGARLRIDPTVELERLNLAPTTLAIARAAQKYGIIVRDKTNNAIGFYAEDVRDHGPNPYAPIFGGKAPIEVLAEFPWEDVQVVKMKLCKPLASGTIPCKPPSGG